MSRVRLTTVAEIQARITATGLDLDGVALIVSEALAEDLGGRGVLPAGTGAGVDVTSVATISPEATATGHIVARRDGILAGVDVAAYALGVVCAAAGPLRSTSLRRTRRRSGAATGSWRSSATPARSCGPSGWP